jgi:hypothetical protein
MRIYLAPEMLHVLCILFHKLADLETEVTSGGVVSSFNIGLLELFVNKDAWVCGGVPVVVKCLMVLYKLLRTVKNERAIFSKQPFSNHAPGFACLQAVGENTRPSEDTVVLELR